MRTLLFVAVAFGVEALVGMFLVADVTAGDAEVGHQEPLRLNRAMYMTNDTVWLGWSCVFSNGVDRPVAVAKDVGGRLVQYPVLGTNVVQEVMASGEVCKITGHLWFDPWVNLAIYHPDSNMRKCRICGLSQYQDTSWK